MPFPDFETFPTRRGRLGNYLSFAGVIAVDCYFHNAVPSVALCRDCNKTICATCRDAEGTCPGCRLERRIDAAAGARGSLGGGVGPSNPPPGPTGGFGAQQAQQQTWQAAPRVVAVKSTALANVSTETRALLALGYPFWPLAALALLDPKRSPAVRRQASQALGTNFGLFGLWVLLEGLVHVPILGLSAWPLLTFLAPIWLVATVVYGVRVFQGDEVRVPLVSDWLDEREASKISATA
jgi:hypothetical protein